MAVPTPVGRAAPEVACDVAIVGAGPIGVEVAIELRRAGVDFLLFDAHGLGYTVSWYAPGTTFFSSADRLGLAGIPLMVANQTKPTRELYLAYLRSLAMAFQLEIRHERVRDLTRESGGGLAFAADLDSGGERRYRAARVVLATGDMARPVRLGIAGEELPHVSHYLADPHGYFGRRVAIVGGRNSAVEAALRCYHAGARPVLSYRRGELADSVKYWLRPELEGRIARGEIGFHPHTVPVAIERDAILLAPAGGGSAGGTIRLPADRVLLLTGYEADRCLFQTAGVTLGEGGAPVFDAATMETDVASLYVAGTAIAAAGASDRIFIENCHIHARRIAAALTGREPPPDPPGYARPES